MAVINYGFMSVLIIMWVICYSVEPGLNTGPGNAQVLHKLDGVTLGDHVESRSLIYLN